MYNMYTAQLYKGEKPSGVSAMQQSCNTSTSQAWSCAHQQWLAPGCACWLPSCTKLRSSLLALYLANTMSTVNRNHFARPHTSKMQYLCQQLPFLQLTNECCDERDW